MKYFRLEYKNGTIEIAKAENALALIKERDLCTKDHISTRIIELQGEQLAVAISSEA